VDFQKMKVKMKIFHHSLWMFWYWYMWSNWFLPCDIICAFQKKIKNNNFALWLFILNGFILWRKTKSKVATWHNFYIFQKKYLFSMIVHFEWFYIMTCDTIKSCYVTYELNFEKIVNTYLSRLHTYLLRLHIYLLTYLPK
jgi:hypothetical protein